MPRRSAWFGGALVLLACEKPAPEATKEAPAPPVTTASTVAAATPPSASVAAPPASVASVAPAATLAPAPTHAASHASKPPAPSAAPSAVPEAAPAKTAQKHITGKNFGLDVVSSGCHAASECAMTIKLVATGDFHVNKEYPYKFTAAATPNVTFLGKGDASSFSRASGDFAEQGEKSGVMTVRFKPASAGDVSVSGTYKLSVCSADQCQVEQQAVDLVVPVM